MTWRTGELDQRVTFNSLTETEDSGGGHSRSFDKNFSCWAKVMAKSGNENTTNDIIQATGSYTFIIRYREDFDETNQIVWNGNQYNIKFKPDMGGRKLYLTIEADRGVAQ